MSKSISHTDLQTDAHSYFVMPFPSREERSKCWDARDQYWQCLEKNQTDDEKHPSCTEMRKFYEKFCSSQWVKHFDRKRKYLQYKYKIEHEGYEPLTEDKRTKV